MDNIFRFSIFIYGIEDLVLLGHAILYPRRLLVKTSTNRNVDNQNVDKPKRRQTKTSTDQNVDKPKRRQTKTSTNRNVDNRNADKPKRRHSKTSA